MDMGIEKIEKKIEEKIEKNLKQISILKIADLNEEVAKDVFFDWGLILALDLTSISHSITHLSDPELRNFLISLYSLSMFNCKVEPEGKNDSKIFTVTIEKKGWKTIFSTIEKEYNKKQEEAKTFLDLTISEKQDYFKNMYPSTGLHQDTVDHKVKDMLRVCETIQQINLDSIKSIYDRIKKGSVTIKIDLTNK